MYSFVTVLTVSVSVTLSAATYYVSPNGSSTGNGSDTNPWNLATALSHPAAVRPGDIILLKEGIYRTTPYSPTSTNFVRSKLTGAANQPITVMPAPGARATIDGGIEVSGAWVIFRDLEITSSHLQRVTSISGPWPADILRPGSFTVLGTNVKLINNVLHDGANGIEGWAGSSDNEYYGNVIYYQGWLGPDRGHGHGLYLQNQYGSKQVTDNIIFEQFDQGIQAYGSSATFLNNMQLEGNIVFNNGQLANLYTRNILVGGTAVLNNPVVVDNYSYYPTSWLHGAENNVGYSTAGGACNNLTFRGNYFVTNGQALSLYRCTIGSFTGNTLWGYLRGFSLSTVGGINTLITPPTRPSQPAVFVRPNRYERGRGQVAVFNWDRRDVVSADISGIGLSAGDVYEVIDVQNYYGAPVATGTYVGGTISIPMTSTAIAPAIGNVPYPPVHSDKEFGAFIVRRRGGGNTSTSYTPSTPTTVPLQISNVAVSQVTSSSAVVTWTTDRSATTSVAYGTSPSLGLAASGVSGQAHSIQLSSLTAGATYYLRVQSTDSNGVSAQADGAAFVTTVIAAAPLQISGVGVSQISPSSAVISWTTNRSATSEVIYGTTNALGSTASGNAGTAHAVTLTGLTAGTTYYLAVRSIDGTAYASASVSPFVTATSTVPVDTSFASWTEGENGARVNFSIVNATGVSAGKYIESVANGGVVTWPVWVPSEGTYFLWTRAQATSAGADTLYVTMDDTARVEYAAGNGRYSTQWQWSAVGASPMSAVPKPFTLTKGWHKLYISAGDVGVRLDGFLITNNPTMVPNDQTGLVRLQ